MSAGVASSRYPGLRTGNRIGAEMAFVKNGEGVLTVALAKLSFLLDYPLKWYLDTSR
jgi:hypothetical protein